jgi:hypothetical protein
MPLPDRSSIKADLVSLIRKRGTLAPGEAYTALADTWRLTAEERARVRGGRSLYEHEIRWARQELVIEGIVQNTKATGKGAWTLSDATGNTEHVGIDNALSRMIQGFLDPDKWFLSDWLPRYEETVRAVRRAIDAGEIDEAVDAIWRQQDNYVSNAGQGVLAAVEIVSLREFFGDMTRDIARDPSPAAFGRILAAAEHERAAGRLSKVPRLLIARAFATIAPDRYHTTVDAGKHEQVISWFEKHTPFRGTTGNWAHKAAGLSRYLAEIAEFDSVLVRNIFPWFVFTQLDRKNGRPVFTPGHRKRARATSGGVLRVETQTIILRHNLLVENLHDALTDEHGENAVGTEQPSGLGGFVDAVVKLSEKRYWIYEVKVAVTASDAIRQALGQLLEYAFREGAWNPQKMFVVGEPALDDGSRRFLSRLRRDFRLPVEYRQVVV